MEPAVSRHRAIRINRAALGLIVAASMGGYFWEPAGAVQRTLDILVRTYLGFLAGALAHEAVHGHLGNCKAANIWWGRLAMIPTTVPFQTFRRTHLRHHAATNIPEADPDEFLNTRRSWEIPFRALALPHHWMLWLRRHGMWKPRDRAEYALTYAVYGAVYGSIAALVGVERVVFGLAPALFLHSLLLWYGFAIKTHEGYSTGVPESRSHNYYGRPLFWATLGLSMHRLHHLKPGLAWLQMADRVPAGSWSDCLLLRRQIQPDRRPAVRSAT